MPLKKMLLLSSVLVLLAACYVLDLGRYLNLGYVQASHSQLSALCAAHPVTAALCFFALYVAITALSIPGAALLTLTAGALFGLGWGLVITSFASSVGALLAFWTARYLLQDSVQRRFGRVLTDINAGIEQDGALYLFTLRLVPLVPFFVINLAFGLTRMKAWTFYAVSQLGMLAGTLVYVNAGTHLAQLKSLHDVLSPALLGSLALLGVFPLLASKAVALVKARQVYARWRHLKPRRFDRNLIVIGAGAGGLVSAYIAAAVKAKVTLVEAHKMGGDCLNYGCVPSKALIATARLAHKMRHAQQLGLQSATPLLDFRAVIQRVHDIVANIAPHDSVQRYTELGVEVISGHATLTSPWYVDIRHPDGSVQRLSTRAVVIAAGAQPLVPPLPGLQEAGFVTSDTLWSHLDTLDELPQRIVVLGGGPIGCELAQCFARLGAQVTVVEMAERLLGREDEEVSALVRAALVADGVHVLTAHTAVRCEGAATSLQTPRLVVAQGGTEAALEYDLLICALGRVPRLSGYGLEALGIPSTRVGGGTVATNAYLQTLYPNIYAAGDVAGPYQFTHVAAHQAWYASVNALFGIVKKFKVDYTAIPWATFVDPEVARVGINEQEAQARGIAVEVTRFELDELDRQICDSGPHPTTHGFVKVLTEPGRDRILGVTVVGDHAAELLPEYVLAMKHGLGLNKILGTVHTYPTLAEANKYAAGQWRRAHQPHKLLAWAARFHAWRRG